MIFEISNLQLQEATKNQMVNIPEGSIVLRDDRKETTWSVEIKPFKMSKFLVTQDLYSTVTQQNPSAFKEAKKPVENVSWLDAVRFCNQLSNLFGLQSCYILQTESAELKENANGYRLPSEAEWEFACRAGSQGTTYGPLENIAWYGENSNGTTHKVGMKQSNSWGLFDMLGNVWEWCSDLYDAEVYGPYRVFRGGGWNDPPRGCLATNRRRSHPTFKIDDLGFRLARSG